VILTRATSALRGGDHQASQRGVIDEGEHGRWCHSLRKSACFSMCAGSVYWCHFPAKSFAISTNGTIRSESKRWPALKCLQPDQIAHGEGLDGQVEDVFMSGQRGAF
jgi:hypothetical protein